MLYQLICKLQDRAAWLLGLDPGHRSTLVRAMLHRPLGDAAGYWLQIIIATVLATLGLALGSTAVVIGAMLIAPLMRPIVELAMGLATGSPPLAFRAGARAIASIVVVVTASIGITLLLPFHEVTSELLARTGPSLLDLFVAAACALAGAYAVVLSHNDVATTAAGTSIGISLVPPLCTAGYGLAIHDWDMAIGAGLLFTANVTGIITFASALFVILGFGQVDIREEERSLDEEEHLHVATRVGRVVVARASARLGPITRLVLPLLLLGAVAVPLESAVEQMSQRSAVRQRVAAVIRQQRGERIVQYSLDQTSRPMTLRVVMVGEPVAARALEQRLQGTLRELGEPRAAVSVWAVPDAMALTALSARLDDVPAVVVEAPPPAPPPPPPPPLGTRIRDAWPAQAGAIVAMRIDDASAPEVEIWHLGPAIGEPACEILARAVTVDGAPAPTIRERPLVAIEESEDPAGWLASALELLGRADELPGVWFCVTTPPAPRPRARRDPVRELVRTLITNEVQRPNITVLPGDRWRIVPQLSPCVHARVMDTEGGSAAPIPAAP